MTTASARYANIVLGVWLFISAFVWQHSPAQFTNTWVLGVAIIMAAAVAFAYPVFRYVTTALAVWLFISAWALPTYSAGTVWNNVLVAIAVFALSLVGPRVEPRREMPADTAARGARPREPREPREPSDRQPRY